MGDPGPKGENGDPGIFFFNSVMFRRYISSA